MYLKYNNKFYYSPYLVNTLKFVSLFVNMKLLTLNVNKCSNISKHYFE